MRCNLLYVALEFVNKLEAYGGTELMQVLKHVLQSNQEQNIILLTDGEISNTGILDIVLIDVKTFFHFVLCFITYLKPKT
jgi:hypothetical protein